MLREMLRRQEGRTEREETIQVVEIKLWVTWLKKFIASQGMSQSLRPRHLIIIYLSQSCHSRNKTKKGKTDILYI